MCSYTISRCWESRRLPGLTLVQAAKTEYSVATMIWRSLGDIVTGKYGLNDLSGPVGTVDFIGDAVAQANTAEGMKTLLMLVTMITVNVGIFNLLPLPALDGGRLMFLIFEGIFRRPGARQIRGYGAFYRPAAAHAADGGGHLYRH